MPFPSVNRVKYKKSPLDSVVCQLRFPPILRIDSQTPFEFQEIIRDVFPVYNEMLEFQHDLDNVFQLANSGQIINPVSNTTQNKNYEFVSRDGFWKINLTRTFISLSTTKYSTWEDFYSRLEKPLEALIEIYKPSFFTRIGLRYVDIFKQSSLDLVNVKWCELFKPEFIGFLGSEFHNNINEFNSVSEISCDDKETIIRVVSGIVRKIGDDEKCLLLDCDVFTNKAEIGSQKSKLDYMHDRASRLLRYAITDKLHEVMEPEEL